MKIDKIETIMLGGRHLFVKVYTDEGLVGLGESGLWGAREGVVGTIERLKPVLIGFDVDRISYINEHLYSTHQFKGMNIMSAISAIDMALWDIKGQRLGVPLYELFGGAYRDKIRLWKSIYPERGTKGEDNILAQIKSGGEYAVKEEGYTAVRITPDWGLPHDEVPFLTRLKTMYKRVEVLREAVGENVDIGIEIHRSLTPDDTIRVCNALEELGIMFYEDPCRSENVNTLGYVSSKTRVPLAAGERCISLQEFEMMHEVGLRYSRPDISCHGGFTGAMKAAAVAEAHHAFILPHTAVGCANLMANVHYSAAIPNFLVLETCPGEDIKTSVKEAHPDTPFEFKDGYLMLPKGRPGLGMKLHPDAEKLVPVTQGPWVL